MISEVGSVHNWLRTTWKISVPDDWLEACVEWIHSENGGVPTALSDMCNLAFEQWLVCDLREIGSSCLPPGLSQHTKHVLNGTFGLQINSMTDVGTSFYGQLQKVRGTENSNASVSATQPSQPAWEPKPTRLLMMKLTDGAEEIQAMEYQPIPALSINLKAGTKVVIFGKVLCRSGVLFLKSENIRVLGGEVDSLVEENTAEAVLRSSLLHNTDENTGQRTLPKKTFEVEDQKGRSNASSVGTFAGGCQTQATVVFAQNDRISELDDVADDDLVTVAASVDEMNNQWFEEDTDFVRAAEAMECDLKDSDTRWPAGSSATSSKTSRLPKRTICDENKQTTDSFPSKKPKTQHTSVRNDPANIFHISEFDDDDDDFDWQVSLSSVCKAKCKETASERTGGEVCDRQSLSSRLCERAALCPQTKKEATQELRPCLSRSALTSDVLSSPKDESGTIVSHLSVKNSSIEHQTNETTMPTVPCAQEKDITLSSIPASSDLFPFTYLSQILGQEFSGVSKVFNIKAYISTLVGPLEHNQGSHWSLVVKINDGSAVVDMLLSNEVLTQLIGFSSTECMHLRELARRDASLKRKLMEGIQRCQETLVQLSAIMEIELSSTLSLPCIRSIHPITSQHVAALVRRLKRQDVPLNL